jgi:predicted RNase H-like HicB family nuclease
VARNPAPEKTRPGRRVVGVRVRGRVYRAELTPDLKVGGYRVRVPLLPCCVTEGDTLTEAKRMVREAIGLWLESSSPSLGHGRTTAPRRARPPTAP